MLSGVNVALGVTGSIAAVRTVELAHELRRRGATVRAVTTDAATGIVHPWALEFATGHDVVTELTGAVEHVELCGREGWADVLLVAPATGNTVGKVAAAVDDTPVTTCATTAIGADLPVVVAPAMHEPMYDHPGIQAALDRLGEWGVDVVPARIEEGKAKLATDEAICTAVARATGPDDLSGERVVVTAGATAEAVDPVRVLTNRASGRTGRAVARACHVRGADVTLVHGRGGDGGPDAVPYADLRRVESAAEMTAAVLDAIEGNDRTAETGAGTGGEADAGADALVSAAAISDYTVEARPEKIPSGQEDLTLALTPTPKLIDEVRAAAPDLPVVGFKVETDAADEALVERARDLVDRVGLSFVVANDASAMGGDRTRALLVPGEAPLPTAGSTTGAPAGGGSADGDDGPARTGAGRGDDGAGYDNSGRGNDGAGRNDAGRSDGIGPGRDALDGTLETHGDDVLAYEGPKAALGDRVAAALATVLAVRPRDDE